MLDGQAQCLDSLRACAMGPEPRVQRAGAAAALVRAAGGYRWVGLYDVTPHEIVALAWTGDEPPAFQRFPVTAGLSGAAVASGAPVVVNDVARDPRYLTTFGSTRSEMIVPVRVSPGVVVGTVDVESERVDAFGERDQAFLESCARALAPLWWADQW